jgi:hypothetical protein
MVKVKLSDCGPGEALWGPRLMLPEFIDNRHMKMVRFVSLKYRPPLPPEDILGIHFCYRLMSRPQGQSAPEGMSIKNLNGPTRNRVRIR